MTGSQEGAGCGYQGYEFGAGRYPDSYCIGGFLHDADSDYLNDEKVPCPMCDREAAIQWWYSRWKDMSEPGDHRDWDTINAEHMARATNLVDDIRFNRGITRPARRLRRVGNKRARKLRRRGTRVWWCPTRESYVWEMTR